MSSQVLVNWTSCTSCHHFWSARGGNVTILCTRGEGYGSCSGRICRKLRHMETNFPGVYSNNNARDGSATSHYTPKTLFKKGLTVRPRVIFVPYRGSITMHTWVTHDTTLLHIPPAGETSSWRLSGDWTKRYEKEQNNFSVLTVKRLSKQSFSNWASSGKHFAIVLGFESSQGTAEQKPSGTRQVVPKLFGNSPFIPASPFIQASERC